jgi:RNA polymerase sigma factor (sigma-70 family)
MWAITEAGRELVKQAPPIVRDRPKPVMTPEAERLFRENQRLAFCFANRLAREWDVSPQDRADLEQEALIGLWRAAIDFRPELGNQFVSLVYVAVRNRCSRFIRVWRHHRPTTRVSVVKTQPVDPQPGPCDQADRTDRIELLRRLLTERLTSDEQRAVMAILEGSSVKGHARLVGIGRAAASYRLHQAAKKLNLDPEFFTRIGSRNRKSLCHGGQASC